MPIEHSDAQLIAACINGQAWAWDALVDRYKRLVYSIALRAGLGQEDAADVFQTVFTVLIENLRDIREPQGLAAWLMTTAKRVSWNTLRRQRRIADDGDETALERATADEWLLHGHPDEGQWADQALVREAVQRIEERCKRLLWLLYYDVREPSYDEISRRLKMPLGSIGPTRARCLQKLRTVLQAMGMSEA